MMTRPLRSTPPRQAGTSPLLQAGPPAHPASVLSPLRVRPAWGAPSHRPKGGRVRVRLPTFHAEAADQAHVAFMPDTVWPRSGHPPDSSRAAGVRPGFDATYLSVTTRQRRPLQRGAAHRLPGPHLTHPVRLFHLAHHDGLQPTQQVAV